MTSKPKGSDTFLWTICTLWRVSKQTTANVAILAHRNQAFDRNLRHREPTWGLRDLEAVAAVAQSVGFSVPTITEMPANNLSVVFRRI
jgi:hypothetical protein